MRTALTWVLLAAAMAATSYLAHRTWPSHAEATMRPGGDAGAAEARPWNEKGFRDDERCEVRAELYGEQPPCL